MSEPLDELYLTWLYSQLGSVKLKNHSRTYWSLLRQLYTKEFVWLIPNDDNRVEDGNDLRYEFVDEQRIANVDRNWMGLGCSVLEMMVALSRALSFEAEGEPRVWFWHMIENLELSMMTDAVYKSSPDLVAAEVDEKLNVLIWRTYAPDGSGGLFPLKHPNYNQRDVELWYQLNAYLLELG